MVRCVLEFQYFESINDMPVSQWVKVEPPIIWKRKSTKRTGNQEDVINWSVSLRVLFWWLKANLEMTYLSQSDKTTMFLPFIMNAEEKTLAKVLVPKITKQLLGSAKSGGFTLNLGEAQVLAEKVVAILQPFCSCIMTAGSIRRGKAEVGDVDIVALPKAMDLPGGLCGVVKVDPSTVWKNLIPKALVKSGLKLEASGEELHRFSFPSGFAG